VGRALRIDPRLLAPFATQGDDDLAGLVRRRRERRFAAITRISASTVSGKWPTQRAIAATIAASCPLSAAQADRSAATMI
jgi:hypothetical protein